MIVCKFGGTSVAGDESSLNIKKIVKANNNRKFVIVSALGKSKEYSIKVTDCLLDIFNSYSKNEQFISKLDEVFKRYEQMSLHLKVNINWKIIKEKLVSRLQAGNITKQYLVSRGEYYSAILYSKFLNATFLDAKDYIVFKKDGEVNYIKTKARLLKLNQNKTYVMGGFYGSGKDGSIKLFERGGADITGAVVAKCLNAEIYENYTDVDGVYDKNPNIFNNATSLPVISFSLALKMAENGNEIVNAKAIKELKNTNVLLLVKSTKEYQALGSIVTHEETNANKLYVCVDKSVLIKTDKFDKKFKNNIGHSADINNVYYNKCNYFVMLKNSIKPCGYYANLGFNAQDVAVIKIFSKNKIDKKSVKILKKIKNKCKKYAIFCEFVCYCNNFTIITALENYNYFVNVINKYVM